MTKGELKTAINENILPDDTQIMIGIGDLHDENMIWRNIRWVGKSHNGTPILIGLEHV